MPMNEKGLPEPTHQKQDGNACDQIQNNEDQLHVRRYILSRTFSWAIVRVIVVYPCIRQYTAINSF